MPSVNYITRTDLDDALAKFRDETVTVVADAVAAQLRNSNSNIGVANSESTPTDPVPGRTLESDAAAILESIGALRDEVASGRSETREIKAEIGGLRTEVKAEFGEVRKEVKADIDGLRKEVKSDIDGLHTEVKSNIDGLRKEVKADIDGLRTEVKSNIDGLRKEVKAEIGEVRTEVKAEIGELRTEVKAEIGEVRTEVKAEIGEVRTEVKAEIVELRKDVKSDVGGLRRDMGELREMRGEVRIIKWMFGLVIAALIAGLTIVHQDLGRRIDGVRTQLHASADQTRTEMAGIRTSVTGVLERLVRLETRNSVGAVTEPATQNPGAD